MLQFVNTLAPAPRSWSILTALALGVLRSLATEEPLDYRYAPPDWQTSICLPDDWQKTLVGKDGSMLYDYPGEFSGFATRIRLQIPGGTTWISQSLAQPRVPVVVTTRKAQVDGCPIELTEEAFAVTPSTTRATPPGTQPKKRWLRVDSQTVSTGWATPPSDWDPAFRDIAVGYNQAVHYRIPALGKEALTLVAGICEGWHAEPGKRILQIEIEGRCVRTLDPVRDHGKNNPVLIPFEARDENGDGYVDFTVAAAPESPDKNTILNLLWVLPKGTIPDLDGLRAGRAPRGVFTKIPCGAAEGGMGPGRMDALLATVRNLGDKPVNVPLSLTIDAKVGHEVRDGKVMVGAFTQVDTLGALVVDSTQSKGSTRTFGLKGILLAPGQSKQVALTVARRGENFPLAPNSLASVVKARSAAETWWNQDAGLPYGRIRVPDPAAQALLDSCIRNIYQAREIKSGLPAFQVGPTCYRGLWVVDGSFLLEAATYLGREREVRAGIKYLMGFQRKDGSFMLIDGHWKETGIVLWAVTRHAELTGDDAWLRENWPALRRAVAAIRAMRGMPAAGSPNEGLTPDGFSDGGLAEQVPEYTNVYWTLAGLRAIADAAERLRLEPDAADMKAEYDLWMVNFRKAAARDMLTDAHGNRCLPIRMARREGIPVQKAQWAFLHAVFPGRVFEPRDPLVLGNMAMLAAVEKEGLVLDTGWLKDGLWNYFGSFYAHAWLWLGQGAKSAETLYAFANHASPLMCWREEHMPQGAGSGFVGDMPHNWASAEFIRLARHSLALERGSELHLLEGLPQSWLKPGAVSELDNAPTSFGPLSMRLQVSKDGKSARLRVLPPKRREPSAITLHLGAWAARPGTQPLAAGRRVELEIPLAVRR